MGRFPEWNTDACCSLFWPYRYRIFFLLGLAGIWPVFYSQDDEETSTSLLSTKS